jgi:predicted nucleic acid-binding Zn finger protein
MFTVPVPKTAMQARRLADVSARAATLFTQQSYTAYLSAQPGVWGVYSPVGRAYTVNLISGICSCPDFTDPQHQDFCKHLLGLFWQLEAEAEEEALEVQAAEHDALEDGRLFLAACRVEHDLCNLVNRK